MGKSDRSKLLATRAGFATLTGADQASRRALIALVLVAGFFSTEPLLAKVVTNQPYQGITYITRKETSPRDVKMHIVLVDLTVPGIRFKLTPPGGTRDTVRQTTLDFLNQEHAQVAVNGHFFVPFLSDDLDVNVVGYAASEAVVYSPFEPQPVASEYDDQSYAILPYAPALNIDPSNRVTVVHPDPADPDHRRLLEQVTVWTALSGSAQTVSNGVKNIPTYSGPPDGLVPGDDYSDDDSWYSYAEARTCIGVSRDGRTFVLFTVDEEDGSDGMTPGEVADVLIKDYAVYNALNLDGGSSTTMALQDPTNHLGEIVNSSSYDSDGRAVGSNLAVFAPAIPGPTLRLILATASANGVIISWPASAKAWQLQQNPGLQAANWSKVSATAQQIGDQMQVELKLDQASRFYRLTN